jgi:hypothetical protein
MFVAINVGQGRNTFLMTKCHHEKGRQGNTTICTVNFVKAGIKILSNHT